MEPTARKLFDKIISKRMKNMVSQCKNYAMMDSTFPVTFI